MAFSRLVFRVHAIQRMFQRRISEEDVRHVLETGEIIEEYLDDTPYPSQLMLGWHESRPLHIIVADNEDAQETIVVTVYEPGLSQWEPGFKRRRRA